MTEGELTYLGGNISEYCQEQSYQYILGDSLLFVHIYLYGCYVLTAEHVMAFMVKLLLFQCGAMQEAFFTPWSSKAVRKIHANLHQHKAHCSYTPGFSHSTWHSSPHTAYLFACITGISAPVNGIKTSLP